MEKFNMEEYSELSPLELKYKEIFLDHPEFEFDKPNYPHYIDSCFEKLDMDAHTLMNPNRTKYKKDDMTEKLFPKSNDVIISKHLRYSPCFIHSHRFFEIIFVLSGKCANKISNHSLELKKGDVCIMSPNTYHALSVFSDDCIVINLLVRSTTFEKSFFGVLKSNDILSLFFSHALYSSNTESYLLFTEQNDMGTISSVLDMFFEHNCDLKYSDRMLTSMMTSFFIRLLRADAKNIIVPNPTGSHTDRNIVFILNHITNNYKTVSLKELSAKFNYSERQMARILKEYTDKTFINIIQDIKLQNACELLKNPDISINKIIETIGYSNTTHFYKIFKKNFSVTPVEFREIENIKNLIR